VSQFEYLLMTDAVEKLQIRCAAKIQPNDIVNESRYSMPPLPSYGGRLLLQVNSRVSSKPIFESSACGPANVGSSPNTEFFISIDPFRTCDRAAKSLGPPQVAGSSKPHRGVVIVDARGLNECTPPALGRPGRSASGRGVPQADRRFQQRASLVGSATVTMATGMPRPSQGSSATVPFDRNGVTVTRRPR
jgi:hypothetical protein